MTMTEPRFPVRITRGVPAVIAELDLTPAQCHAPFTSSGTVGSIPAASGRRPACW